MSDPTVTVTLPAPLHQALGTLFGELVRGAATEFCWTLNPADPGLLRSLDRLSADAASAAPAGGGASIAAHVDHLCYGLELLLRWSEGENPFADADYSASWRRQTVSDAEWRALRERLEAAAARWHALIEEPRPLTSIELTGSIASVVHLAYHLGAMRQIDRALAGPAAAD